MATALQNFVEDAPLERARAIARGLPARLVRDLVADPAVTIADVARIVGPRRTIDRRLKDNTPLSPDESDRFARFVTVLDLASGIFGSWAAAMGWLGAPNRRLDGEPPLDLPQTHARTTLLGG